MGVAGPLRTEMTQTIYLDRCARREKGGRVTRHPPAAPVGIMKVIWYRFTPGVIDPSQPQTVLLEAKTEGSPGSATLELQSPAATVALKDDGTGGDKTARKWSSGRWVNDFRAQGSDFRVES